MYYTGVSADEVCRERARHDIEHGPPRPLPGLADPLEKISSVRVRASRTCGRMPIRSAISTGPNRSTAYPPHPWRSDRVRSTTPTSRGSWPAPRPVNAGTSGGRAEEVWARGSHPWSLRGRPVPVSQRARQGALDALDASSPGARRGTPYSHPCLRKKITRVTPTRAITARTAGYPQVQESSGMWVKFMP